MRYNQNWDDLGRSIQDAVDWAVNSRNYHHLNQTIRQAVETAVDVGGEAIRRAAQTTQETAQTVTRAVIARQLYGGTLGKIVKGSVLTALGFPIALFGGLGALWGFAVYLAVFAVGGWMTFSGMRTLNMVKRFKTYRRLLGTRTTCALDKLARAVGKSVGFVRADLRRMFGSGLFLEGHLDKEETVLITSDDTFQQFEQARLQLEQSRREAEQRAAQAAKTESSVNPQLQEVLNRGNAFIAQIRKCNDDIPGEEISAKIDRMELIVRRIFERAQAHPEIVPDLKKLMDYYLPMTVKLLSAYADMDVQPIQGETILASKREIEGTLDTLNLAFEKLLDSVFQDTAMDVSSDISVLHTMLAQEGLTEDELTKMRKQQK